MNIDEHTFDLSSLLGVSSECFTEDDQWWNTLLQESSI